MPHLLRRRNRRVDRAHRSGGHSPGPSHLCRERQRDAVGPAESVLRRVLAAAGAPSRDRRRRTSLSSSPWTAYVRRLRASQRSRAVFGEVAAAIAAQAFDRTATARAASRWARPTAVPMRACVVTNPPGFEELALEPRRDRAPLLRAWRGRSRAAPRPQGWGDLSRARRSPTARRRRTPVRDRRRRRAAPAVAFRGRALESPLPPPHRRPSHARGAARRSCARLGRGDS